MRGAVLLPRLPGSRGRVAEPRCGEFDGSEADARELGEENGTPRRYPWFGRALDATAPGCAAAAQGLTDVREELPVRARAATHHGQAEHPERDLHEPGQGEAVVGELLRAGLPLEFEDHADQEYAGQR